MANRISATIAVDDITQIQTKLDEIRALLPFLVEIEKSERKRGQKMGTASVGYVRACVNAAVTNTDVLARKFSVEEFQKDVALLDALLPLDDMMETFFQKLRDTVLMVGKDLMEQANEVYGSVKTEAKKNNSLKPLADSLGEFYKKSRGGNNTPPNPS